MRTSLVNWRAACLVFCLVASMSFPVLAQDGMVEEFPIEFPWYASLTMGRVHFEGDEELKPGFVSALKLGYDFNDRWSYEVCLYLSPKLDANKDDFPSQKDASMFGLAMDGLFHFTRWERLDPYLAAGVGFSTYSETLVDSDSDSETVLRGGGGVMYHLNDEWTVRGDFRGVLTGFGDNPNAGHVIDVGVAWAWGAGVAPVFRPDDELLDTDKDGLLDVDEENYGTDKRDPDTDDDGLQDGPEVHKYGTDPNNADSDFDLLSDGAEILNYDTNPLKADTDNGQVIDGHEVLEDGTDPKNPLDDAVLYTLNIRFDTDKTVIKPRYFSQIDTIGKVLRRNAGSTAVIEGHADKRKRSKKAYNDKLSHKRAEAVLEAIATRSKIDKSRLEAHGYGFSRPIAPNDPLVGNEKNRRVEIYIKGIGDKKGLPDLPDVVEDIDPSLK